LILESYQPKVGPNSGWVHLSLPSPTNRNEVLTQKAGDKMRAGLIQ
jgi:hypothetical protein